MLAFCNETQRARLAVGREIQTQLLSLYIFQQLGEANFAVAWTLIGRRLVCRVLLDGTKGHFGWKPFETAYVPCLNENPPCINGGPLIAARVSLVPNAETLCWECHVSLART